MSDAVLHAAPGQSASRTAWAMPLIPVAVSGFLLSAMTSLRLQGALPSPPEGTLAGGVVALYRLFGFEPLFMVCVLTLTWSSIWFLTGRVERPLSRLARIGALGLSLAILVNLRIDGVLPPGGGELGALLASRLASVISPAVSIFAVAVLAVAALLLATDFFFYGHFERLGARRVQALELDAVEPEVDADEQAELESLALSGHGAGSTPSAAAPVVPSSGPSPASEGRAAAPRPRVEAESETTDAEALPDCGADVDDAEIWALEEDLSSVTLLGPRRTEEDSTDVVAPEEEVVPAAASVEVDPEVEEEPSEPCAESGDHVPSQEAVRVPDADAITEGPASAEGLPMAPQGAVMDEHEAVLADPAVDLSAADEPASAEGSAGDSSASAVESEEGDASGGADAEPEAAEQDPPEPRPERAGEQLASLEIEPGEAVPAHGPTSSDPADEPIAGAAEEPVVELIPAPRVAPERSARPGPDPDLVEEAAELVVAYRRASANFLKRRLRVADEEAMALLQVLAARGIIECEAGATQGRIRGG
ncbi:MAG: DNA translocase FtsK 4TM domain-containing protein [Planctomycetota bacterium]|nr:DNA translocase FtsK 4TM domain-containing protein [Planctomycetota bacterium]